MAIPVVDKGAIEQALRDFDVQLRPTDDWANWEANKAQSWVLEHEQRRYPPKKIISLATGMPVGDFSGGPETNDYLAAHGFTVARLRDSSLSETFAHILKRYGTARATEKFAGNHEVRGLFLEGRRILQSLPPVARRSHIHVVASYGKGNWAAIPWISLLDDRETQTTQDGTYVVFLFREDGLGYYLKLAQGVTRIEKEIGARALEVLAAQAAGIRAQCTSLADMGFDLSGKSDLGSTQRLAKLYEASTIAAKYYPSDSPIDDAQLTADIEALLERYELYVEGRAKAGSLVADTRRLSLMGTWRGVRHQAAAIKQAVEAAGAWASPWSFPLREEALPRLVPPFYLYAYEGDRKLTARLTVAELATSRGQAGIASPWPAATNQEWVGLTRSGDKQSDVFKTWFKVVAVDLLDPPRLVDDFELALGLSSPDNVLNQNTFGYLIEDDLMSADAAPSVAPSVAPAMTTTIAQAVVTPQLEIDWLVARTGLKRSFLQEIVDAVLGLSPQIMLVGPPGTSKTHLAQALALFVARNRPELVRLVQFHPGYTYESFIEGLRPVTHANGVSFELTDGVVREAVRAMQSVGNVGVEGNEYVVIIDEANRANLPRVLGELMYLFEYRDRAIRLQYSGEFSLPRNLRFIATMNTADRSIRAIDVALRRRFDVFELAPDPALLADHYGASATSTVADLVDGFVALNQALETSLDRHHTIGHAFFMRANMDAAGLHQVWKRKVFPLIEEFFFDQPDLTGTFSLERFWPSAADEK